jgi:hypothetical protein
VRVRTALPVYLLWRLYRRERAKNERIDDAEQAISDRAVAELLLRRVEDFHAIEGASSDTSMKMTGCPQPRRSR